MEATHSIYRKRISLHLFLPFSVYGVWMMMMRNNIKRLTIHSGYAKARNMRSTVLWPLLTKRIHSPFHMNTFSASSSWLFTARKQTLSYDYN